MNRQPSPSLLALALLLAGSASASSPPMFGDIEVLDTPPLQPESSHGIGLLAADLNNDQYDDIITVYADTGYVTFGGPSSESRVRVDFPQATAYHTYDLALIDIDRDGDSDLIVARDDDTDDIYSNLLVHLNAGNGTFGAAVPLPIVGFHVEVADMDADGFDDIVTEDAAGIFYQIATGPMTFADRINVPNSERLVGVAHLSDDILADIVAERFSWIRTDDSDSGTTHYFSNELEDRVQYVGDVDSDGAEEIVIATEGNLSFEQGTLVIVKRWNGKAFIEISRRMVPMVTSAGMTALDFDDDGDLDLVLTTIAREPNYFNFVSSLLPCQALLLTNSGTGEFSVHQSMPSGGLAASAIISGRFSDTMASDVVIASKGMELSNGAAIGRRVCLLPVSRPTPLLPQHLATGTSTRSFISSTAFFDINDDGVKDLICAQEPRVSIRFGIEHGRFDDTPVRNTTAPSINHVTLTDVDSDDQLDVIASSLNSDTLYRVKLAPATTPPYYVQGVSIQMTALPADARVTRSGRSVVLDLDQDGDLDYITYRTATSANTSEILVDHNSSGDWIRTTIPLVGVIRRMEAIDAKNDAAPDIVLYRSVDPRDAKCSCHLDWRVELFYNNGQGSFDSTAVLLQSKSGVRGLAVGDIGGSSDNDIVVTTGDHLVHSFIRENDGFSPPIQNSTAPFSLNQPVISDFDLDGNADLAGSAYIGDSPSSTQDLHDHSLFLFGDGNGHFADRQELFNHGVKPWRGQVEDFNEDGTTDYISLNSIGGVTLYPNLSTPPAPCPADANADGLVDGGDLSVLLAQFGDTVTPGTGADFNDDGVVNGLDLSVLLSQFGTSCQ